MIESDIQIRYSNVCTNLKCHDHTCTSLSDQVVRWNIVVKEMECAQLEKF